MTYKNDIPQPNVSPNDSRADIQANFSQWAAKFSSTVAGIIYNHTAMNKSGMGKHQVVLMEKQTSDPTVKNDFPVLYCKDVASKVSTQPQLFSRVPNFLPDQKPSLPVQMTYNTVNTAGAVYQSFVIGGYLLFFGVKNGTGAVTLSPDTNGILAVQVISNDSGASPARTGYTINSTSQFTINSNGGAINYSWMALALA